MQNLMPAKIQQADLKKKKKKKPQRHLS